MKNDLSVVHYKNFSLETNIRHVCGHTHTVEPLCINACTKGTPVTVPLHRPTHK